MEKHKQNIKTFDLILQASDIFFFFFFFFFKSNLYFSQSIYMATWGMHNMIIDCNI